MLQEPAHNIFITQKSLSPSILKNGDIVFVRVVEDNGSGSYTASFAGNRFIVRSLHPLSIGSSFKAQIHLENSMVKLIPIFESSNSHVSSTSAYSFLHRIGLPSDDLSLRIMQFFQQNQLKINLPLAQKVRHLSASFPGREKEAAETALFLDDKNIDSTEEMTEFLLTIMQGERPAQDYDKDVLSYINHKKGSARHWIIIPFSDEESSSFTGIVKILINTDIKKTEKIVIDCKTSVKKYLFVLQLHELSMKSPKRILTYCTEPSLSGVEEKVFTNQLRSLFSSDGIEQIYFKQSLSEDGIFCENSELSYYQGSV